MAVVCETGRLRVRHFSIDDAPFIVRLLNEPSFIRHIADKGVRTPDDARTYLRNGPLASYGRNGFGLSAVVHRDSGATIGMCGLIRRDGLPDVDIGYAFLPEFWSQGYAAEAVRGVLHSDARHHGLQRVVAVVNPDNAASIRLLQSLGFGFETMVVLPSESTPIQQFAIALQPCVRLTAPYAQAYRALMLEAYTAYPDAFTSSTAERATLPLSWWEERLNPDPQAREVVLGVFQRGALAGVVGLAMETREKARHKATLFGMYVQPAHQRAGLGQLLVQAALEEARGRADVRQVLLTVTQGNARAQALYERCGFESFGVEPDAVMVGRTYVAKVHMWHQLQRPNPAIREQ